MSKWVKPSEAHALEGDSKSGKPHRHGGLFLCSPSNFISRDEMRWKFRLGRGSNQRTMQLLTTGLINIA